MLKGVMDSFAAHFGIKCSSFCKVNVGTSMRSACTALGFWDYLSVASSNKLLERKQLVTHVKNCYVFHYFRCPVGSLTFGHASGGCVKLLCCCRTCTLIFLCTALGGLWSLEQPGGSLLEFYPTWRFVLHSISKIGGPYSVISLDKFMPLNVFDLPGFGFPGLSNSTNPFSYKDQFKV